jgi:CheY-like chemotaxis protein
MSTSFDTYLVVEDEPSDAFLIQRAFAKANVPNPVRIARDGEEAIEYLGGTGPYGDRAKFPLPKIMLLDLKLPRRSGLEVLAWVRSQPRLKRLKVVVLTSSRESRDVNGAADLGVSSHLVKPVDHARLVELVTALDALLLRCSEHPDLVDD